MKGSYAICLVVSAIAVVCAIGTVRFDPQPISIYDVILRYLEYFSIGVLIGAGSLVPYSCTGKVCSFLRYSIDYWILGSSCFYFLAFLIVVLEIVLGKMDYYLISIISQKIDMTIVLCLGIISTCYFSKRQGIVT
jgi:hypothetical protein